MRTAGGRRLGAVTAAAAVGAVAAGCGSIQSRTHDTTNASGVIAPPTTHQSLSIETVPSGVPLLTRWAARYHQGHDNIDIEVSPANVADIVSSLPGRHTDAGITPTPASSYKATLVPGKYATVPLALSADVVDYHLAGAPQQVHVNAKVLAGMYDGAIKTWNDPAVAALNPGAALPATPVTVGYAADAAGATRTFTSWLAAADPTFAQKVGSTDSILLPSGVTHVQAGSAAQVAATCGRTDGCVVYLPWDSATTAATYGLTQAGLAGAQAPSTATLAAAVGTVSKDGTVTLNPGPSAYPLSSVMYALVHTTTPDKNQDQAVKAFLSWCVNQQDTVPGTAPLPAPVRQKAEAELKSID